MKKVSLKQLKSMRDIINDYMPDYLGTKAFITAFGRNIENNEVVAIKRHFNEFAMRSNANWSYHLVIGETKTTK
jgi:hypothetical protein